jgi:prepilin-type N-terminal cleavage/methylation domain-containing protein
VRVDHQSDRMDAVDVTVKPGTTGIYRRQGFTMLEVMISLAILGTVLSSVIASIYTLNHTRVLALEQSQAQELGRLFVERIMAEPWGNLHSSQIDSVWRANHVGDPNATPLSARELRDKLVIDNLTVLDDLKVYVEYYPYQSLVAALENRTPMALTPRQPGRDRTMAFRIVIDWESVGGGRQQHTQIFARSE